MQNLIRDALNRYLSTPNGEPFQPTTKADSVVLSAMSREDAADYLLKLREACNEE